MTFDIVTDALIETYHALRDIEEYGDGLLKAGKDAKNRAEEALRYVGIDPTTIPYYEEER